MVRLYHNQTMSKLDRFWQARNREEALGAFAP